MKFNRKELADAIKIVSKACNQDISTENMKGIYFQCNKGICSITACDGYRIHTEFIPYEGEENLTFRVHCFDVPKGSVFAEFCIVEDDKLLIIYENGMSQELPFIQGDFVDITKFLPKTEPVFKVSMKAKFLKEALIGLGNDDPVIFESHGTLSPIMIHRGIAVRNRSPKEPPFTKSESYRFILPVRF